MYNITVEDENNKICKYKVDVEKKSHCKPQKWNFLYLAFFVLCGLMCISFFSKCSTEKNEMKNDSSYELSMDTVEIKKNNLVSKKYDNYIPYICMTIFCTTGIVLLFVMVLKDDGGIRFDKLNSLMSLRKDFDSEANYEITSEECVKCKKCQINKDSNDCSIQDCCKNSTKKKSLYGEITKTLMNSISEI